MTNNPSELNRRSVKRFVLPVVAAAAATVGAFAGPLDIASAVPRNNDQESTYELAEGGDLDAVNCEYMDLGAEGVAIFRTSRDTFLGFDSEVVQDLRTEGLNLIEIGERYGVDEEWILQEVEKMHAHCLELELPEDQDNDRLVEIMERFDELSENDPGESGRAAGQGTDNQTRGRNS